MNDDFRSRLRPLKSVIKPDQSEPEPPETKETFVTPDEAAAADDLTQKARLVGNTMLKDKPETPEKPSWRERLALHWPPGKKEALVSGVVLLLCVGGGFALIHTSPKTVPAGAYGAAPAAPKITTVPSNLTGLPVQPSVNKRPVTAVMIENSLDARPQSGLSQAGVVFEAVAEGGVTRFMALYQDNRPSSIGPIRSARPYYVQWALGFDAAYAHVGGSPDALSDITRWDVKDMNQFYNGNYYHRITSREAPHNVYTAVSTLNKLEKVKGYKTSSYTGFPRKPAAPAAQVTAKTIDMTLSGYDYDPHFAYSTKTHTYKRSEAGAPQMDAHSHTQIAPKVVIAIVVPETQGALDSSGAYYSNYDVLSSGRAYVFQDGTVTKGRWSKASNSSQIVFTNSQHQPLLLDPGQTWITAIVSSHNVKYHS